MKMGLREIAARAAETEVCVPYDLLTILTMARFTIIPGRDIGPGIDLV